MKCGGFHLINFLRLVIFFHAKFPKNSFQKKPLALLSLNSSFPGLTALKADEVYDVMQKDFPDKYSDYARLIQQRQREAVKNQHKEYGTVSHMTSGATFI